MRDHIQRLQLFFKRKDVDLSDNKGDDNCNSEYGEFLHPELIQSWTIALISMTDFVHFKAKFTNSDEAMLISTDEYVRKVVHYRDNIVLIHC